MTYPSTDYERAAEALADAAEDVAFCEDPDGTAMESLRERGSGSSTLWGLRSAARKCRSRALASGNTERVALPSFLGRDNDR
jgi:hypothetical protein